MGDLMDHLDGLLFIDKHIRFTNHLTTGATHWAVQKMITTVSLVIWKIIEVLMESFILDLIGHKVAVSLKSGNKLQTLLKEVLILVLRVMKQLRFTIVITVGVVWNMVILHLFLMVLTIMAIGFMQSVLLTNGDVVSQVVVNAKLKLNYGLWFKDDVMGMMVRPPQQIKLTSCT